MTYRILSPALVELAEAAENYESKAPGLGADFIGEAERVISRIMGFPKRGAELRKITGIVAFADFHTRSSTRKNQRMRF